MLYDKLNWIYAIVNKYDYNKYYIGSTTQLRPRIRSWVSSLSRPRGYRPNRKLQPDWKELGYKGFDVKILLELVNINDDLVAYENLFIKSFGPAYNIGLPKDYIKYDDRIDLNRAYNIIKSPNKQYQISNNNNLPLSCYIADILLYPYYNEGQYTKPQRFDPTITGDEL